MSWLDGWRHRVRTVLRPRAYDAELREEMQLHVELDAQQNDAARARRRFGNREYYREETRRLTWLGSLDVLRQDARYAWRSITRTPGLTCVIVLTLALGIGVNAATFTVLDRLYLRPPGGITDAGSLRRVWVQHNNMSSGEPFTTQQMNYPMFRAIASGTGEAARLAVFTPPGALALGRGRNAPDVQVVWASANYFSVLGARAALGRFYTADEDQLGAGASVAVVSHAFWSRHLGGDRSVLGRPIEIGRQSYTVIGVAARSFTGLDLQATDVWIPLGAMASPTWSTTPWWQLERAYSFRTVRRLRPSDADGEFERRATAIVRRLNRELFPARPDTLMRLLSGSIIVARGPGKPGQERIISTRLAGVAVIVLLIAGANIINLLLARAVRRQRETAVRLALGVSPWRLVRLLTTETLLLAGLAAIAALFAASWGGTLLRSLLVPGVEWTDAAVDGRVALFTAAIALIAGLVAGIVPAVQSSNPDLTHALKAGARHGVRHRSRLRAALVITQAALSVTLLIGATLFVRSLHNVKGLDIGYDAGRLLFGRVKFEAGEAPPQAVIGASMRALAQRLEQRPGVEAVARASNPPMYAISFLTWFSGPDSSQSFPGNTPTLTAVTPTFFRAAGMRVLRGRGFTGVDAEGGPAEVVVNETMAELVWPGRDALGQCMHFVQRRNPCYPVVGIVEDVRQTSVIEDRPAPQYYLPLGNMPVTEWAGTTLIVRSSANPAAATRALNTALRQAFPTAEATVTPMLEHLEPEYRPWRLGATLFTSFGLLALLVALIGIYTTVSYGVSQRTHEFGVRLALGARVGNVLRQVVGEGVRTVAIGVIVGVALALAAGRLIAALLYGVEPHDPVALLLVSATILIVAALAALVPAWRAARVDPLSALRAE